MLAIEKSKNEEEREREGERGEGKHETFSGAKMLTCRKQSLECFLSFFFLYLWNIFFFCDRCVEKSALIEACVENGALAWIFSSVANKTFRLRQHSSLHWCCREVFLFPPSKFSFQFRYFLENVQSIPANATYSRIPVRISGPYSFSQKLESLNIIIAAHAEVTLHFLRSRLLGSTAISDHYMQVQP